MATDASHLFRLRQDGVPSEERGAAVRAEDVDLPEDGGLRVPDASLLELLFLQLFALFLLALLFFLLHPRHAHDLAVEHARSERPPVHELAGHTHQRRRVSTKRRPLAELRVGLYREKHKLNSAWHLYYDTPTCTALTASSFARNAASARQRAVHRDAKQTGTTTATCEEPR